MKRVILAILLTILVVTKAEDRRKCTSGEDCEKGECCLRKGFFESNICAPVAKENESCSTERRNLGGKYYYHCPCESGLACEPEKIIDHGILGKDYVNERCVSQLTTGQP